MKRCVEPCPICLDALSESAVFLDCGHSFCYGCLLPSLAGEQTPEREAINHRGSRMTVMRPHRQLVNAAALTPSHPGADVPCSRWRCPCCRTPTGLSFRPATVLELGRQYVEGSKAASCGGGGGITRLDINQFFSVLAAAQGLPPGAAAKQPQPGAAAKQPQPAACSQVALPSALADVVVGWKLRSLLEPERGWRLRWCLAAAAALACVCAMLLILGELTQANNRATCLFVLGRRDSWCYEATASLAMPLWFEISGLFLAAQLAYSLWLVTPFWVLLFFDRCALPAVGLWAGVTLLFALAVLVMRIVFEAGAAFTI